MRPHGTAGPSTDGTFLDFLGIVALVSDTPEEPEDGTSGPGEGGGSGGDGPDSPQRGWIDPDDRLWRHPSEVAGPGRAADVPFLVNPPPHHNYRSAVMVLVGVGAVMAVVAWVIVLLSPASEHPLEPATQDTAASGPLTTLAGAQNARARRRRGRRALDRRAGGDHQPRHRAARRASPWPRAGSSPPPPICSTASCISTWSAPAGSSKRPRWWPRTRRPTWRWSTCPRIFPWPRSPTTAACSSGTPDLALTFVPAGGRAVALHCTPGAVTDVGAAIASGPAATMPSITSSPATPTVMAGEPLLDSAGSVLGILYDPDPGTSPATFLPSDLVVGVADDLRSQNRVVHGWLGVQGTDAPDGGGAKVAAVQSGGPASGRLQVGQLIVAVNSTPVRSMAELRALLYVLPPGSAITLSVQQPAGPKVVDVTLGTSS